MYHIQRAIDQHSQPMEFETLIELPTESDVTAWLSDRSNNVPANLGFCGREVKVVGPGGEETDKSEWLYSHIPAQSIGWHRLPAR